MSGHTSVRLDGGVCRAKRTVDMMLFNRAKSPIFLFLATTRTGSLGLNLQSADTVVIFDSDWNPQVDVQAMARVHRIGQTKPVAVFRLVTSNTVEERIVVRAVRLCACSSVCACGWCSKHVMLFIYVCVYVCMYASMCMYVCMYVCM